MELSATFAFSRLLFKVVREILTDVLTVKVMVESLRIPMHQKLPVNLTNELAKARNRAAAERTLMAWIRTSLALISFGFGIDQVIEAINRSAPSTASPGQLTRSVGLMFIAVGIYAIVMAIFEHQQELEQIQRDDYVYRSRRSHGVMVATSLVAIGLFAFMAIAIKSINR